MKDKKESNSQNTKNNKEQNEKTEQVEAEQRLLDDPENGFLTTDQGLPVANNQEQFTAGERGPTLMEDHVFREKMTRFDHERIPERVVHARGSAAHGYFQVYKSMAKYTKARFLQDPSVKTPVFVRFLTVVGFRGSPDTVRDVRGFATKFYTEDGNYDLVGNNMAPFFIQDAMKFPDLVHSIKPEPHHEMPQASAAHEGVQLLQESDISGVQLAEADGDGNVVTDKGVVTVHIASKKESVVEKVKGTVGLGNAVNMNDVAEQFIEAIAQHRHWSREKKDMVPA